LSIETRELYASPNGDRWYLARYPESGRVFVQHVPNVPSGGQPATIELGAFLSRGGNAPELQALVRLVGTLVETSADAATAANSNSGTQSGTDPSNEAGGP
jgi:hypothetical protein